MTSQLPPLDGYRLNVIQVYHVKFTATRTLFISNPNELTTAGSIGA